MKSIKLATIYLTIVTIVTKIFGAFRDFTLSYCYGSSILSDMYLLATTIPVTVFTFLYEGIAASFLPALSSISSHERRNRLVSNLINSVLVLCSIIVILIEFYPSFVLQIFASGLPKDSIKEAVYLLRVTIFGGYFTAIAYVFVYYLNYKEFYILPILRAIPMDIVLIASLFLSLYYDKYTTLAIGVILSLLFELLFLMPIVKKTAFKYECYLNFKDQDLRKVLVCSIPVILSSAIADINSIIDRQYASWIMVGGISILTYSSRTLNMVRMTFLMPIVTIVFPKISRALIKENQDNVKKIVVDALYTMIIISIPLAFGIIFFSNDIITILFQRGAFTMDSTRITASCLTYYSLGLFFHGVILICSRVFYAMTDMKTPLYVSSIGIIINVILNYYLSRVLGLPGLALGSSISTAIIACIEYKIICGRIDISSLEVVILILKSLFSSVVMYELLNWIGSHYFFDTHMIVKDTVLVMTGTLSYLVVMVLLKTKQLMVHLKY